MVRKPNRGLTLIELVVVIVIMAMLLGLSVAVFKNSNRDLGVRASVGQMVASFRAVREFSRINAAPSWVVLDLNQPHSFYVLTAETVGMWHFESESGGITPGALGRDAQLKGVRQIQGRVGNAFEMRASSKIDCGDIPIVTDKQGISVDFWLWRRPSTGKQTLCTIGDEFEMRLSDAGKPQVRIGDVRVSAPGNMTIPFETWVHVMFVYNGMESRLFINKSAVATVKGSAKWEKNSPLEIGAQSKGYVGIMDEFRVGLIVPRDRTHLPREVEFEFMPGVIQPGQTEFWVYYDQEGRLDSRIHSGPIRFKVKSPTDTQEIRIPTTGIVTRLEDK